MSLLKVLLHVTICVVAAALFCSSCLADASESAGLELPAPRLTLPALTVDDGEPEPEESETSDEASRGKWAGNPKKFFLGAFSGLLGHEAGHLIANVAVGSKPHTKSVKYGPIPFFTIEPGRELTPREHYITASAGFNSQHIINEWLLTKHPNLRDEDEPFLKGMATFNFWLTVGYAATAFAKTGPPERDTKGMADALGWSESRIGVMILVPTLLDAYRYKHPDSKWAKTASRLSKLYIIGLAVTVED